MNTNLCIIQARMGSTRLHGKVLKKVRETTLLEYEIKRVKQSKRIDKIIIATTTKKEDDIIAQLSKKIKINCFRGSEDDVLNRYYQCSLKYPKYKNIIRLTGDCPLVDPYIIDKVISLFEKEKPDYASNIPTGKETYPDGINAEIFSQQVLAFVAKNAKRPLDKEHVNEYILRNKRFKKIYLNNPIDFSHFRLTIDYSEDFKVMKFLIQNSKITDSYLHYISLLTKNLPIMLENTHIKRNLSYLESLKNKKINRILPIT